MPNTRKLRNRIGLHIEPMYMKKAQITVEYLLLSLIAITLISFSILSLGSIKNAADKSYDAVLFKSSAIDLGNAMGEACALGSGSMRMVFVRSEMDVSGTQKRFAVFKQTYGNLSIVRDVYCDVLDATDISGNIKIENNNGEIELSKANP